MPKERFMGFGGSRKLPVWFSEEEIIRLFSIIENDQDRFYMKMLYYHGLRLMELFGLIASNVRLDDGVIVVRGGKGGVDRTIPIAAPMKAWLEKVVRVKKGFLVPQTCALKTWERHLQRKIKMYARRAGIKDYWKFTPHKLRHSYATHLSQKGVKIEVIKELMGHKSIATTDIYTHILDRDKKEAVEKAFKK